MSVRRAAVDPQQPLHQPLLEQDEARVMPIYIYISYSYIDVSTDPHALLCPTVRHLQPGRDLVRDLPLPPPPRQRPGVAGTVDIHYFGMKDIYETKSFRCQNSDTRLYGGPTSVVLRMRERISPGLDAPWVVPLCGEVTWSGLSLCDCSVDRSPGSDDPCVTPLCAAALAGDPSWGDPAHPLAGAAGCPQRRRHQHDARTCPRCPTPLSQPWVLPDAVTSRGPTPVPHAPKDENVCWTLLSSRHHHHHHHHHHDHDPHHVLTPELCRSRTPCSAPWPRSCCSTPCCGRRWRGSS
jgi:hypothetical protein